MFFIKKIIALLISFAMIFAFAACSSNNEDATKNYDAIATAGALNAGMSFGAPLDKNDNPESICIIYNIDPSLCTNAAMYSSGGVSADELAVFNCVDAAAVETVLQALDSRIAYLADGYSTYGPDQIPKIESAVIKTSGNTVIFCICENPENIDAVLETVE